MNRNKLGIWLNVALVATWGYTALKMIFTDYTPSRPLIIGMAVVLTLESLLHVADWRLKYWQEQKALALEESETI